MTALHAKNLKASKQKLTCQQSAVQTCSPELRNYGDTPLNYGITVTLHSITNYGDTPLTITVTLHLTLLLLLRDHANISFY